MFIPSILCTKWLTEFDLDRPLGMGEYIAVKAGWSPTVVVVLDLSTGCFG